MPAGADAKIIVRVDLSTLVRDRPIEGEVCEIVGMGPIPVAVVKAWMENAFLAAVVTQGTEITKVVHLGRRFTSEQRTALQWLDPICARKGCSNRLGLEYAEAMGGPHAGGVGVGPVLEVVAAPMPMPTVSEVRRGGHGARRPCRPGARTARPGALMLVCCAEGRRRAAGAN